MKRVQWLAVIGGLVVLSGCSLYRNDRQFVWDSEYQRVRDLYDRCGSVVIVCDVLKDYQWTPGQINEVLYRLHKDYFLDADGIPQGIDRPRPVTVDTGPLARVGVGSRRGETERDLDRWERGY